MKRLEKQFKLMHQLEAIEQEYVRYHTDSPEAQECLARWERLLVAWRKA